MAIKKGEDGARDGGGRDLQTNKRCSVGKTGKTNSRKVRRRVYWRTGGNVDSCSVYFMRGQEVQAMPVHWEAGRLGKGFGRETETGLN